MSDPIHHRGDKPCFACKYHEYNCLGTRYDKCSHPDAFVVSCSVERSDTSSKVTCGRSGQRFEIKAVKQKKWWEFWKQNIGRLVNSTEETGKE